MSHHQSVLIFDTTLRDGEQSPGASLTIPHKVEIAHQLVRLGVDVIEAGFPVSSPNQFEAVQRIAAECPVTIAALARAKEDDIHTAFKALSQAKRPRIHTFVGTSDQHILGKFSSPRYGSSLADKRATVIKMATDAIRYALTFCKDVEFSAEDSVRTDVNFLVEVVAAAVEAGATTINIPDTTGFAHPSHYGALMKILREKVPGIEKVILSAHCHDDLGLAVANSLCAIENGARQIECTVNGIGERAGNAALEEVVMALKIRNDFYGVDTGINTKEIYATSRLVAERTGIPVQPNKAIVGANAFAHESGIHQDGMLKNRDTYEIMDPSLVGVDGSKIVLGRHSGQHGLKARLKSLGFQFSEEKLKSIYGEFLILADGKKEIDDEDLKSLLAPFIDSESRSAAK